jgi:N-acetylglucosamine kinase-like BadF-type ATPase
MPVIVGVDAGGSRTIAIAARSDGSQRTFVGKPANPQVCGIDGAAEAVVQAIVGALDGERPGAIAVGAAGAGRVQTASALAQALRERFPGARVAVTDDAHVALRGAIPAGDGIVLIAGTGSIAYGEIGGHRFRAGGGGYALGDDGSGFAIGSAALKLLMRWFEGRAPGDPMLDALAARACARDIHDVIAYAYESGTPVRTVAEVASVVLEFANAGERSASKIVQNAALELFELVRAVCRMASVGTTETAIAFSGGLLCANSLLTYLVETRISNELPHLRIVKNGAAPHFGALEEARELLS